MRTPVASATQAPPPAAAATVTAMQTVQAAPAIPAPVQAAPVPAMAPAVPAATVVPAAVAVAVAAPPLAAVPAAAPQAMAVTGNTPVAPPAAPIPMQTSAAPTPMQTQPTPPPPIIHRKDFNGVWILDKTQPGWSMRGYLETLHVNELAIQAHEKGELEHETMHRIELGADGSLKITKRSRVNNDLVVRLTLGVESVEHLKPDNRPKKCLAQLEGADRLKITNSLLTMNGMAHVEDIKTLIQEEGKSTVLLQKLTINNEQTNKTHTMTRHFLPTTDDKMQPRDVEMETT